MATSNVPRPTPLRHRMRSRTTQSDDDDGRRWRFTIRESPSPPSAVPEDAILVLIDVVEYTPQSVAAGSHATKAFDAHFRRELSARAERCGFQYVKPIGDAALLWGTDAARLVDLILDRVWERSKRGEIARDYVRASDFFAAIRDERFLRDRPELAAQYDVLAHICFYCLFFCTEAEDGGARVIPAATLRALLEEPLRAPGALPDAPEKPPALRAHGPASPRSGPQAY